MKITLSIDDDIVYTRVPDSASIGDLTDIIMDISGYNHVCLEQSGRSIKGSTTVPIANAIDISEVIEVHRLSDKHLKVTPKLTTSLKSNSSEIPPTKDPVKSTDKDTKKKDMRKYFGLSLLKEGDKPNGLTTDDPIVMTDVISSQNSKPNTSYLYKSGDLNKDLEVTEFVDDKTKRDGQYDVDDDMECDKDPILTLSDGDPGLDTFQLFKDVMFSDDYYRLDNNNRYLLTRHIDR